MADSYEDLRDKFFRWVNRDAEVFINAENTGGSTTDQVYDFFKYAADKAYRALRIPVFERAYTLTIDETVHTDLMENNRLPVPVDLTEFIHIRIVNAYGNNRSIVLNEKADTRTFHDYIAEKYDPNYTWTRQGRYIYLPNNPGVRDGMTYEIFYYGRLPQIGTRYDDTFNNYRLGFVSYVNTTDPNMTVHRFEEGQDETVYNGLKANADIVFTADEVNNWFVHENERVLLFGALAEAFSYLGEDDMFQKYIALFQGEIAELNKEEDMRKASGGNVRMNFNGRGLI